MRDASDSDIFKIQLAFQLEARWVSNSFAQLQRLLFIRKANRILAESGLFFPLCHDLRLHYFVISALQQRPPSRDQSSKLHESHKTRPESCQEPNVTDDQKIVREKRAH